MTFKFAMAINHRLFFRTDLYRSFIDIYRSFSSAQSPKICIIGSGPAGFYVAQHLLKALPNVKIDMFEKLPVPFGLVRYGVAPDHPEVKNVISTFNKVAHHQNFNFYGNVSFGKDVMFKDLKYAYHAVVLSYGCNEEKKLGIQGEDNMVSARRFVGWYNGLPSDRHLNVNLDCEDVTLVGQGNVAIDVARIILTPIDILRKTDITSYALDELSKSKIKKVNLVGRRGPLHVAFTIKEFREMTKLPGVRTVLNVPDIIGLDQCLTSLERPRKRLTELLIKITNEKQNGVKDFCPIFFRKPLECKKGSMKFQVTTATDNLKGIVDETDQTEEISSGLFISSVGYKGTCEDPDLPFDNKKGTIISQPGVYACGWIGTGPVGIIISTMNNAFCQAGILIDNLHNNLLKSDEMKPGYEYIKTVLDRKSVTTISFQGWEKIDKVEIERGKKLEKPREKIVKIDEMIEIGAS